MPTTYKIKINEAEVITVQDTGERMLSVQFKIVGTQEDGETTEEVRRHGFKVDITPEEVEAELVAVLTAYLRDKEVGELKADEEAENKQAEETIAALQEKEIEATPAELPVEEK